MIIDSHIHLWHYNPTDYAWINDQMHVLKNDFLTPHLRKVAFQEGVVGCIAVQARQSLEENHFLLQSAEVDDYILGVVGWVDFKSDQVEETLQRLAVHKKLKGFRHIVQDEPNDNFLLDEGFNKGIAILKNYDFTYDILIYPKHLKTAHQFAAQHPGQKFVVDHLAKPDIKNKKMKSWQDDISLFASLPNVSCKISGMVTEAAWCKHTYNDFEPYLEFIFEIFGANRLMFGSDWPVCLLSAEYSTVLNYTRQWLETKGPDVQQKILYANAAKFYNIESR